MLRLTVAVAVLSATADAFSAFPGAGLVLRHGSGTSLARAAAPQASPILAISRPCRLRRVGRAGGAAFCGLQMNADQTVLAGDVIGVRYKGTLEDGSTFDENPEGPLLEFEVGSGRVIRGFDEAVTGLKVGESRSVTCEPKNAYGEYDASNIAEVPMDQMPSPPDGMELTPGLVLQLQGGQIAVIKEVGTDSVKLDGNHPLAGKTLTFDVTVKEIKDRAEVLVGKISQMMTVLDNPVMVMLATEITKKDDYVDEIKKTLSEATDKGAALNEILGSEDWITINAALMSNPQLQQLLTDPVASEEVKRRMLEAREAKQSGGAAAAQDAASAASVPEADFGEDA